MRKVILGVASTLDGFIEGPNGEYDWCFTDQDYGLNTFLERVDALFLGRKSYEVLTNPAEAASENQFDGYKKYIFSNTIQHAADGIELISGDIKSQVNEIKKGPGKDIWLFGGASLTTSFMNEGLVDELFLAVHPILLGTGKPLFSGIRDRVKLTLTDSKTYSTGLVALWYRID